jgi:hypothetical protein
MPIPTAYFPGSSIYRLTFVRIRYPSVDYNLIFCWCDEADVRSKGYRGRTATLVKNDGLESKNK